MPEQSKFEDVDLFASLNAVMKQNTGFYQSDLEIDKEIIAKAAASPRKEDKTLLWFCRPSGTHCFRERDVSLLQEERRSREQLPQGDFKAHIAALRDGLIETEARRIVREMKRHYEPNSPNKTHFMVELSPAFMQLAATKDTDRLFSMLPYKTLSFSKIEGRHGTYALIGKRENRDREIRKPRPSVRAQLKTDKAKTAPKKAAAKTKNHDLEV